MTAQTGPAGNRCRLLCRWRAEASSSNSDGINGDAPVRQEMKRVDQLGDASGSYVYSAAVSASRPPEDYTVRVIPHCDSVAVPLEVTPILWQR